MGEPKPERLAGSKNEEGALAVRRAPFSFFCAGTQLDRYQIRWQANDRAPPHLIG